MRQGVERCELAPGFSISRVLTGMWQIADMERGERRLDPDAAAAAMTAYVEAGLTTFDMADHYSSAEVIAGRLRGRPGGDRAELLTKWVPRPGAIRREDVRAAVERSRERLRAECLDLLQFHTWCYDDPSWLDGLFWLQELRDEGRIAHLGVTNFDAVHLDMAVRSGIGLVSNQVCFSLLDRRAAGRMSEVCRAHGVKLLAYGTLGGGFLTERWLGRPEPAWQEMETDSQRKYRRFIDAAGGWEALQLLLRAVDETARRHGVSMANVAARYVLQQPAVGGIIIGARLGEREHIEDNLRLFRFSLDAADRERIEAAAARLRPIPGDCGDEYRRAPFLTATGDLSDHLESLPAPYPTVVGSDGRIRVGTGTYWEARAGYARAVRIGERILVSGTTAMHRDQLIGGDDPAAQTHFVIDKIAGALRSLGGRLEDVVRTRIYVQRASDAEAIALVHGARFAGISPANTLLRADLVGDGYLVEIEAEAIGSAGG